MIDETENLILRFILSHPGATAKTILRDVFENNSSKQRLLYRKLTSMIDRSYLKSSALYPENGASSPKLYFLTAQGAHCIGEKMPRDHAKFQRRDFRSMAKIRDFLSSQANKHNWYLLEENEECRVILASELKKAAERQYGKAEPDYIYLNQIPQKIHPDLVFFTDRETFIVIISHPHAGKAAFKNRIKKYERIIYLFKFMCFTLNEDQKTQWLDVLRDFDFYHKTKYQDRFNIYDLAEIDKV